MTEPQPAPQTAADLFADTAYYYARYRLPYPPELFDLIVEAFGLGPNSRVLDAGCGTGFLTIPLSQRVGEVVAIDVSPEMVAEGQRQADALRDTNITWRVPRRRGNHA